LGVAGAALASLFFRRSSVISDWPRAGRTLANFLSTIFGLLWAEFWVALSMLC
jgi:hypothetical protein